MRDKRAGGENNSDQTYPAEMQSILASIDVNVTDDEAAALCEIEKMYFDGEL